MKARDYLGLILLMERKTEDLRLEIESMRRMAQSLQSPANEERVQSSAGTDSPAIRKIDTSLDLEEELRLSIEKTKALKEEASRCIDEMPDPRERIVLRCRYLYGWDWKHISLDMQLSLRTVYRVHSDALNDFTVPI